jgi:hypothetical protein
VVLIWGLILWAGAYYAHTLAVGNVIFKPNGEVYFHVFRWEGNAFVEYEGAVFSYVSEVRYDPWRRSWNVVLLGYGTGRRLQDYTPISTVINLVNNGNPYGYRIWYGFASFSSVFGTNGWNISFPFAPD